jgi:hypothetical protein
MRFKSGLILADWCSVGPRFSNPIRKVVFMALLKVSLVYLSSEGEIWTKEGVNGAWKNCIITRFVIVSIIKYY